MKRISALVVAVVLMTAVSTTAQQNERFQRFDFKVTGAVANVLTEDLDGDGFLDAVVIHADDTKDPPERFMTVFPHHPKNGFADSTSFRYKFPPEVAVMDVGDVAANPGLELVVINEDGVYYAPLTGGKVGSLKEIFKAQSVVAIPYVNEVPYYNFVRDYNGDGKDDILVSSFYDTTFAYQNGDYTFSRSVLNLRPQMDIDAFDVSEVMTGQKNPMLRVSYRVPQFYSEDYNGDKVPDLLVNFRDEVYIYKGNGKSFSTDPVKRYKTRLIKEQTSARRHGPPPNVNFSDLDGDGKIDILVSQTSGDLTNLKSRSVVYFGKTNSIEKEKPDIEFQPSAPVMGRIIDVDVNKDGLLDLILPTFRLSPWSVGKALLTGDVNVEWAYFIQKPDRTFAATPDRVISTGLRFDMSKFRMESGLPNIVGDFNGDGIPDHAVGEDENTLVISLLNENGDKLEMTERIVVPVSMINRTADLNNDGLSDIVIYYPQDMDRHSDFRILVNRGPWVMEEE